MWYRIPLVVFSLILSPVLFAEDTPDKIAVASPLQRLADRVEFIARSTPSVLELVWLGTGASKAIALFEAPDTAPHQGAVIVMLGIGQLLEQSEFSTSIRQSLASSGWATLIVQTDQMGNELEESESQALSNTLLNQALAHVNAKGYTNTVIVADGKVAESVWPTIQTASQSALGFVGIDEWYVKDFAPTIPVLNVVNRSSPRAVNHAEKRFSRVKKNPSAACELFFYDGTLGTDVGYGLIISKRIRGWIERHFKNVA